MEGDYAKKVVKAQGTYFPVQSSSESSQISLTPAELAAQKEAPNLGGPNRKRLTRRESHQGNYNLLHTPGFRSIRRPSHMKGMQKSYQSESKSMNGDQSKDTNDNGYDKSGGKDVNDDDDGYNNSNNNNIPGDTDITENIDTSDINDNATSNSNLMSNGAVTMVNFTNVVDRAITVDKRNKSYVKRTKAANYGLHSKIEAARYNNYERLEHLKKQDKILSQVRRRIEDIKFAKDPEEESIIYNKKDPTNNVPHPFALFPRRKDHMTSLWVTKKAFFIREKQDK